MSIPYIGFCNSTTAACPPLKAGDSISCPHCGGQHVVEDSTPPMLLFYSCDGKSYMAGINGKNIMGVKSDCSGSIPDAQEQECECQK